MANDDRPSTIDAGGVDLRMEMSLPTDQSGVIVIPDVSAGDGNPHLDSITARLREAGLGTLRLDLLTAEEAAEGEVEGLKPTAELLGRRLGSVLDWLDRDDHTSTRPLGLYAMETGAGAALVAASERPERIGAVVSADGRPDLAGDALDRVAAPTLLLVGDADPLAVDRTREAAQRLAGLGQIETIATEGYGLSAEALEAIGGLAADWFTTHLVTLESPIDVPDAKHPEQMHQDRFPPREGKQKPNA